MLNPQNTNRVMKTYISPEMLAAELDAAQGIMQLVVKSGDHKADKDATVLTKRNVWVDDEDDDEW